jgi:type II secretion system protein N
MSPLPPSPSTPDSGVVFPDVNAVSVEPVLRRWLPTFVSRFGWGLYTLVCFVAFLFLTFPLDILLQRVIATATHETPLRIRYAHGELTWRGTGVAHDVTIEQTETNFPALKLNHLTVQPSWLSLLFGRPFPLTFQANLYGGTIEGTVEQQTAGLETHLTVQHVNLSMLPVPPPGKPGGLKGFLTGSVDLSGDFSQLSTLKGAVTLNLSEGALQAGALGKVPVPSLQSVQGTLQTAIRDGRLNVSDLTLTGDGIEAHLQGTLTLSTPFPRTGLDLQLTTKTVGTPPPTLAVLTSLLPASPNTPGERRATISGSFASPVMR